MLTFSLSRKKREEKFTVSISLVVTSLLLSGSKVKGQHADDDEQEPDEP